MLPLIALLFLNPTAQANEIPCANMAKYAAIRAYKAEVGDVQGSDGIQYSAVVTGARNNLFSFLVSISENNEDGETWQMQYNVDLLWQQNAKPECKVLATKKI